MNSQFLSRTPAVGRLLRWTCTSLVVAVLAACASKPGAQAPVVDRSAQSTALSRAAALPGAENAGKPGYHTVRAGETLTRIAIQYGQDRRNIQAWNQLSNPDLIEVGQVLRVVPPTATAAAPAAPRPAEAVSNPVTAPVATAAPAARPLPPAGAVAAAPAPASAAAAPAAGGLAGVQLIWPAQGDIVGRFDEKSSRGIAISGRAGDPVVAAADGVVAIAGSPIRGLGNLVIIQHAGGVITAYAHNQTLLVKEDQQVRQGQRIADMGSSDSDRVKLHFEVRHQGKPVDPLTHLPRR